MANLPDLIEAIDVYRERGWYPIPLRPYSKQLAVSGVTGRKPGREMPGRWHYQRWHRQRKWYDGVNLALTLPKGIVGLDFDGHKTGREIPADLPPTWFSTARRDDPESGIAFFACPEDAEFGGEVTSADGEHLGDIIWWGYRYAAVWPSIHPNVHTQYRWYDPADRHCKPPYASELPEVTEQWLQRLTQKSRARTDGQGYEHGLDAWLADLPGRMMSPYVRRILREGRRDLRQAHEGDGGRHDVMKNVASRLVSAGARGDRGVATALVEFGDEFIGMIGTSWDRDGEHEYWSAVGWAVETFGGQAKNTRN